ncbi:preprotein translocase subunit SecD [Anaerobranca californiensis DSM 14826]|jgi:preprotein translocase subunit SecD|uniref:Protein translocase subunit SecD n=1 Tax=Anaerobranca californiensis DSM 14826 TaxID=1120989 RepID=A0A1M6LN38_9FIRM|nr:protein translocase subunit SecD [Anaerobranca californiensis]SHJ72607.1 preprotein translocase subunit SecD [Anaerobranca californiensis DSM 14826]
MVRWKNIIALMVILAVVATVTYFAIPFIQQETRLGLDLQGGVYVLLQAKATDRAEVTDEAIRGTIEVLRNRIDELGVLEPIIQREGENRIRIEVADAQQDPETVLTLIGKTALLEFWDEEGKPVITGANLVNARALFSPENGQPVVAIELDKEGAAVFAELTARLAGTGVPIPIVLDGQVISAPVVRAGTVITDGKAIIEGIGTIDDAARLAGLLRSGALPLELEQLEVRAVGPTLGKQSLIKSLYAGAFGLLLVVLFMVVFYRLPGIIASIALNIYLLIVLTTLIAFKAVLTLPGIAGLILTIGMAVDANIIIFERIKEEIRNGKTLRSGMESGFRRALTTILDSNVTTLIVGIILFAYGTGPVRGFAVTLVIGVLVSIFTAVVITKYLLKLLINTNLIKNTKFFGV